MVIGINANGASISPDPRVARDYSQPVQFTLTAPDGTKVVYTVTVKGSACVSAPPPPPPSTPDTTPPVITVLGTNPLSLTVGTAYTEAGATCVDNKDATCTVVTTGTVNTATVGTYIITYAATDAAGNASSKTRTVTIGATTPTGPALADVGPLLDHGGNPITFNLNALSGLPTGSVVVGVTGFPTVDDFANQTNLNCDASGNCTAIYDVNAPLYVPITFPVTVEVRVPGFTNTLKRPLNLIIENEA
jgi:Domain of unknown function (DUF5011)